MTPATAAAEGAISVIVPSRAEGPTLIAVLAELARTPGIDEVIVAAHGESDTTRAAAARVMPSVRWLDAPQAGRGAQLAMGAKAAQGQILLILHADTRLPIDAARSVRAAIARPGVVAGAFRLAFDTPHPVLDLIAAMSACPARFAMFGDQAMFCRRDAYWRAGGYSESRLFEDVDLAWALAAQGRLVRVPAPVVTSARRFLAGGPARQLARNAGLLLLHYLGVPTRCLVPHYPS